ncbi:MAG: hypothetical protein AAGJ93_12705 [Bacteroidota bacterium]
MIRKILVLPFILITIYFIQLSVRMYHQPTVIENEQGVYNQDLYQQLCFLQKEMHAGAGSDMQSVYPEGYVFIHALYALSWANLVDDLSSGSPIHQMALSEVRWSITKLESETARRIFPADMYLP